jgi:SEC-C motif domain protein
MLCQLSYTGVIGSGWPDLESLLGYRFLAAVGNELTGVEAGHLGAGPLIRSTELARRPCDNVRMEVLACPCGLGEDYDSCCGRYHRGAPAPTAEQLMRSRYSAFAVGDAAYLLRTWHPSARPRTLELDPRCRWTRLAVLDTDGGKLFDAAGTVSFRAMYVLDGQRHVLAETSRFVREGKRWLYLGPVD